MKTASLTDNLSYGNQKPIIQVLLESDSAKEIRIVFKKDQHMKRHQTSFPIVVEVFEGHIDFGVNDKEVVEMKRGDLIALKANVPHDLKARADSIVRLSLVKADSVERVKQVLED